MSAGTISTQVSGKKVLLFHREDSVIHYEAASLHQALLQGGASSFDPNVRMVEVTRMGANGYPSHDFPLCADGSAWAALIQGVRWALDMEGEGEGQGAAAGQSTTVYL